MFSAALRWLLKEWVKVLLTSITVFIGWIFRTYIKNWLIAEHALEIYGFIWVTAVLGIILLSILIFWLVIRKPKKNILTDEIDIKNELGDWWAERKIAHNSSRPSWMGGPRGEFTIHCRSVDRHRSLKKGSAAKFLPGIIENDNAYCIKSKGKETIVVQHRGVTIRTGPS